MTTTWNRPDSDTVNRDPQQELYEGQLFPSKKAAQLATKQHAESRNFQFVVVDSYSWGYIVKCHKYKETSCSWEVHSRRKETGAGWIIRKPNMKVLALQAQFQEMFQVPVSYRKAWYAKQRAIEKVYGNWKESYKDLQTLMSRIQSTNPKSVVDWETRPGATPDHIYFKRIFWAFGPCIEGFRYCPPVIVVDGTNLAGKYKGSLLIASSFDGDRNPFPIAFAIVESKNTRSWSWFVTRIEKFVIDQYICIISDMNARLYQTIKDFGKDWKWKWCLRHYVSSYKKRYQSKIMNNQLWIAGMENRLTKFNGAIEKFLHIDAERQLDGKNSVKQDQSYWSQACDNEEGGWRMGLMTTDTVECLDGVFKDVRALPIAALVQQTFYGLVTYWDDRRVKLEAQVKSTDSDFSKYCTTIMNMRSQKANGYTMQPVDQSYGRYEVRKISNNQTVTSTDGYTVLLSDRDGTGSCTCGKFQSIKIPCSHAIACCRAMSIDPYTFVYDFYCWDSVQGCYKKSFSPIGDPKEWKHEGPVLLPDVCNVAPSGVPKQ